MVLVRALHQLTGEMAQARAEARQYAAASERSLSTAWRLGQLGQLGLALLDGDGGDAGIGREAFEALDEGGRWVETLDATHNSPSLTELSPDDDLGFGGAAAGVTRAAASRHDHNVRGGGGGEADDLPA
jgi:hypothetical protein